MTLSDDELSALNPNQRSAYADAVRQCRDDRQLVRDASFGAPWSKTYSDNWKSDFGGALGFLFFLGSFVLFPAALGIVVALGLGTDDSTTPAIAVYVGLLLAIAALKATVTAERPPPRPPIDKLRAARLTAIDSRWRGTADRQRRSDSERGVALGQTGRATPSSAKSSPTSRPDKSRVQPPRSAPRASGKTGARPMGSSGGGSITVGNRSVPGAEYTPRFTAEEKVAIATSYDWVCQLCLKPIDSTIRHDYENPHPMRLVFDHIKPKKHGGTNDRSNLQPAHHRCNSRKGDRLITNEEYRTRYAESEPRPESGRSPVASQTRSAVSQTVRSASKRRDSAYSMRSPRPLGPQAQHAPNGSRQKQSVEQRVRSDTFWSTRHEGLLTHCEQGHEFTEENTYYRLRPDRTWGIERECRACRRR